MLFLKIKNEGEKVPMSFLEKVDSEVSRAIDLETRRQTGKIELIASENFVSEAVLEAQGLCYDQ